MPAPIIRTRGLTKRFGDFTAVDDLSIEVTPGTIFAFLGANGSGKSTTIRMLIGLLKPTAGTVEVDGVDVRSRGLVWDLIQDEAGAGVTVFVTTHFLEEVEYCDWAAFIDAGRLIANATPEALRQRYSEGYRVDVAVPDAARTAVAATLGPVGETAATPEGFTLRVPALDPPVLAALDRLV